MASNSHHEPLKTLGPADWAQVPHDDLAGFLGGVFADAQLVVDSIPSTTPTWAQARETARGRARAKTDPAPVPADLQESLPSPPHGKARATSDVVDRLRDEWKEVKVNARDNPLDMRVYKLASKDGQGSWFARSSVHDRLSFDRWKSGLEREFPETMKIQGSPGSGNIRGIGADKRVEHQAVDGAGHLSVFQLSAQFPGPTAPRDFVTLLLTSDSSTKPSDSTKPLRQYMVVSKPCTHPQCPPRQGIIRGRYESVEVIREIPTENLANKRSFSHADLLSDDIRRAGATRPPTDPPTTPDDVPRAIEWLMVTRSDPGGSVPRFMIDKGTPPGIVGDAGKFLDWAASAPAQGVSPPSPRKDGTAKNGNTEAPAVARALDEERTEQAAAVTTSKGRAAGQDEGIPSSNGLYGIITGAFGVASSVANGLRQQFSAPMSLGSGGIQEELDEDVRKPERRGDESSSGSDTSSSRSFASAVEKSTAGDGAGGSISESNSDESRSQPTHPGGRQLQKLIERRWKLGEDLSKTQERLESKRQGEKNKDAAALAKAREKHERELAKQEAKYKREMKKLEDKREQQERKAEMRRRKTMEKEERSILAAELEGVKAERDVALKKAELLQNQVGELQAQNTMLVAKLGRLGAVGREDSSSSREASVKSQPRS